MTLNDGFHQAMPNFTESYNTRVLIIFGGAEAYYFIKLVSDTMQWTANKNGSLTIDNNLLVSGT